MNNILKILLIFVLNSLLFSNVYAQYANCVSCLDSDILTFYVDLSAESDATWTSPTVQRNGTCCGHSDCIRFVVQTHPETDQLSIEITDGANPGGQDYLINCEDTIAAGQPICATGNNGEICILFCKPGGNNNQYTITATQTVDASPDMAASDGCAATIWATGMQEASMTWNVVYPDTTYNSYLDCLSGCDTVNVTPEPGYPPYIDVEAFGFFESPCSWVQTRDTVRVYFVTDKYVDIEPDTAAICYGGTSAYLTATPSGGAPPYSYLWNTGQTTDSIEVFSAGYYTVQVYDTTNCPPVSDTVLVVSHTTNISAEAGDDIPVCENNLVANLNGVVYQAFGGVWSSTGTGSFSPDSTNLLANYNATAADYASGSVSLILETTGNGGCPGDSDTLELSFVPAPVPQAGPDDTVCANNSTVFLNGSVVNAGGGLWSGGGIFSPNANTLNSSYTPTVDEISAGETYLYLTSTDNGNCLPETDSMKVVINPAPIVNAGIDDTVCANNPAVSLSGTVTNAGGGEWSGGNGTFVPDEFDLNAVYNPTASEIGSGGVLLTLSSIENGTCNPVSDVMEVTITPSPIVDAGVSQTVCANNASLVLNGSVSVATGGTWSGGAGSFVPDENTLNATYTPSASEITDGSVMLYLTSTGNGNCTPVVDSMEITITPAPTANAGSDLSVCGNNATINLSGFITVATGGQWSTSGSGSFSPDANTLNASYIPSSTDISDSTFTLTLTTTGNGSCIAISDQMSIDVTPSPVVNAGPDQSVCANNSAVSLGGSVSIASGGNWSGGSGTYFPNANDLSASYAPSSTEITNGYAELVLTSTGNGTCLAEADTVEIEITPAPVANAGLDESVCANNANVSLSGSVAVATGGVWGTSGTGSFIPDATDLNAVYVPSPLDVNNSSVQISLTTTGNGNCVGETDQMVITITPAPNVNAGANQTACKNNSTVYLNGSISGITSTGEWSSSGTGTFTPDNQTLSAQYIPSQTDLDNGFVTLTLTSTNNNNCLPVADDFMVTFTEAPTAEAGPNQTVCANNASISLSGSYTVATGAQWTSSGTGTFVPSSTSMLADYVPSAADIAAGNVVIFLTTTGNGNCLPATDFLSITILPSPEVNAGSNASVCSNNADVNLSGLVSGIVTSTGIWTSSGSGSFSPSNTDLGATYISSPSDTANTSVVLTLTSTNNGSCLAVQDQMIISYTPSPLVNAGPDDQVCANNSTIILNGSVGYASGGLWTSSGTGSFSPDNSTLNTTYNPSLADTSNGLVSFTLTSTGNGNCLPVSDQVDVQITPAPYVNAGPDQVVCATSPDATLQGTIYGGATTGTWSSTGTGSFTPSTDQLNATYVPDAIDIAAGEVTLILTSTNNGDCLPVSDSMVLSIVPPPTVNAGLDQTVCANNALIPISGTVQDATQYEWSSTGSGTFSPDIYSINALYIPSDQDTADGTIIVSLSATNSCTTLQDEFILNITPSPYVDAGPDQVICATEPQVLMDGNVSAGASTGQWVSSGTGYFVPDNTMLGASYIPSDQDTSNGSVTLTLISTNNGNCNPVTDEMLVQIVSSPLVIISGDDTICSTSTAELSATISGGTGSGIWTSSGTGTFSPSHTSLNVTYTPSAADITTGVSTIVFTTTNNGNCEPANAVSNLIILPGPTVSAGPDQVVCANNSTVYLNGSISEGATQGVWSSSGTGYFTPNANDLSASYIPSDADTALGSLVLTLTAIDGCDSVSDFLNLTIVPAPYVNAGPDAFICYGETAVFLDGVVSGITNLSEWSTLGSGSFIPENTTLNAVYSLSDADTAAGSVNLVLTSSNNGNCLPVTDTMGIYITSIPQVEAGEDTIICSNGTVSLNGVVEDGSGSGQWTSSGDGIFLPSADSLNATYIPGNNDTINNIVTLTLTSTDACVVLSDFITVDILDAPYVNAGPDISICENAPTTSLTGVISQWAQPGEWSTSGSGTFSPDINQLNVNYTASTSDISNGSAILYLTSTNNGMCEAVTDSLLLSIVNLPNVYAGPDFTECAGDTAYVSGLISGGAGTGVWSSSGTGTFFPNDSSLNAGYLPSSDDTTNGFVNLVLTTTNNGGCMGATDQLTLDFQSRPVANAGPDDTICANNSGLVLSGQVWNASGVNWIADGAFIPNQNALTVSYFPSNDELDSESFSVLLMTTGNGLCDPDIDTLSVAVTPSPLVNAGGDKFICYGTMSVSLSGSVSGITNTGSWTSLGTGVFFPDADSLSTIYNLSSADTANGSVDLVLMSTQNIDCNPVFDTITIYITDVPTVSAGLDDTVCANNATVALNGFIEGGSGTVIWTATNGSGTFIPSNTVIDPQYIPSVWDTANGSVTILMTATDACVPQRDTMIITITPAPHVDAGSEILVCEDANAINIQGNIYGATLTGNWSTLGTGSFEDAGLLNTIYYPSTADTAAGEVYLVLESTNNGDCFAERDTLRIGFGLTPIAAFNFPDTVCAGQTVTFEDLSYVNSGNIIGWQWDYDNGDMSSQQLDSTIFPFGGVYYVRLIVTSNNGCKDTLTQPITVQPSPVAEFTSSPHCLLDSVFFENLSTPAVNWYWEFGNGSTSQLQDPVPQIYDSLASYVVSLSITDAWGCSDIVHHTINIHPTPDAEFLVGNMCVGDTATFIDNSNIDYDTITSWLWDLGDGFYDTVQNPVHAYTISDTLSVVLTVSTQYCSNTDSVTVTPMPAPTFELSPESGCSPLSVSFNPSTAGGALFYWNFGDGSTSTNQSPTHVFHNTTSHDTSFTISLVVESVYGCVDSTEEDVTIFPKPTANFEFGPQVICSREEVFFNNLSTGADAYQWTFADSLGNDTSTHTSFVFSNQGNATQYYPVELLAISSNGCRDSLIDFVPINHIPDYNVTITPDSACHPVTAHIIATVGAASYSWDFGDGTFVSGGDNVYHTFVNYNDTDTTYYVQLVAEANNTCIDTSYKPIVVHPSPQAEFVLDTLYGCSPFNVSVTNTSQGAESYYWEFEQGNSDTISDLHFTYLMENTSPNQSSYIINLTAESDNACTNTYSQTINIFPEVTALFTCDTVGCSPLSLYFENQSVYGESNKWIFGDGGLSTNANPVHTFINNLQSDTVFHTQLVATSVYGCKDTSEIQDITIHPQPVGNFDLVNSSGCSPFNANIINTSIGAVNYQWDFGDGAISSSSDQYVNHLYQNSDTALVSYTMTLILENEYTCTDTVFQTIDVYPEVLAAFTCDTVGCSPLTSVFTNQSEGAVSYNWSFGDGNSYSGLNPSHVYNNLTNNTKQYLVRLITSSDYSCKDTVFETITVYPKPKANFELADPDGCSPYAASFIDSTELAVNYFWDFGNGNTDTTTTFIDDFQFENASEQPISLDIELIVESEYFCQDTVSQTVKVYPEIDIGFVPGDTAACSPLPVVFTNLSDTVIGYSWSFGDGGISNFRNPEHTYLNTSVNDITYMVTLELESHYGCFARDTSHITIYATPNAEFDVNPGSQYYPNTTFVVSNFTIGTWDYAWEFGDGEYSDLQQPISHSYDWWGDYEIVLIVSSDYCSDSDTTTVRVFPGMPVADYDSSFTGCAPLTVTFVNKSQAATWYQWDFGDGGQSDDENPSYTYHIPGVYV
ncbi:MAG: hypothetical protein C0594_04165, partial [Marinilabiliales bacterium]